MITTNYLKFNNPTDFEIAKHVLCNISEQEPYYQIADIQEPILILKPLKQLKTNTSNHYGYTNKYIFKKNNQNIKPKIGMLIHNSYLSENNKIIMDIMPSDFLQNLQVNLNNISLLNPQQKIFSNHDLGLIQLKIQTWNSITNAFNTIIDNNDYTISFDTIPGNIKPLLPKLTKKLPHIKLKYGFKQRNA